MIDQVALALFEPQHLELLSGWLLAAHVAPWYPEPSEHIRWATEPPIGGERALITLDEHPVGYLRWQFVQRRVLDSVGLYDIPENSADAVGRRVGPRALDLLAADLTSRTFVPLIGLTSSVLNQGAHRAFRRAGFRILRQYEPPGYGPCYLMVRPLQYRKPSASENQSHYRAGKPK